MVKAHNFENKHFRQNSSSTLHFCFLALTCFYLCTYFSVGNNRQRTKYVSLFICSWSMDGETLSYAPLFPYIVKCAQIKILRRRRKQQHKNNFQFVQTLKSRTKKWWTRINFEYLDLLVLGFELQDLEQMLHLREQLKRFLSSNGNSSLSIPPTFKLVGISQHYIYIPELRSYKETTEDGPQGIGFRISSSS